MPSRNVELYIEKRWEGVVVPNVHPLQVVAECTLADQTGGDWGFCNPLPNPPRHLLTPPETIRGVCGNSKSGSLGQRLRDTSSPFPWYVFSRNLVPDVVACCRQKLSLKSQVDFNCWPIPSAVHTSAAVHMFFKVTGIPSSSTSPPKRCLCQAAMAQVPTQQTSHPENPTPPPPRACVRVCV